MVDLKAAVGGAIAFAKESLGPLRTANLRLEEIESSTTHNGRDVWLITLSNALVDDGPLASVRAAAAEMGTYTGREYKVFAVAKDTGEVLSMKIRALALPTAS